jgi:partner of Y14 and mago
VLPYISLETIQKFNSKEKGFVSKSDISVDVHGVMVMTKLFKKKKAFISFPVSKIFHFCRSSLHSPKKCSKNSDYLMPPKQPLPASGIQTNKSGERIIPASVRADGSIRPERRVKQGYTPTEDVATYKNERVEEFRSHQHGHKDYVPPGLGKPVEEEKKKRRRPKKKDESGDGDDGGKAVSQTNSNVEGIGQEDPEKKARALRKKIRQARELKDRAAKGDKLEASQIAKIEMLEVFEKELAALDIDNIEES